MTNISSEQKNSLRKVNSLDDAQKFIEQNESNLKDIVNYCIEIRNHSINDYILILTSIVFALVSIFLLPDYITYIWIGILFLIAICNLFIDKEKKAIDYILTQLALNGVDN